MDHALKGTKLPTFDGKAGSFAQWSYVLLSYSMITKCRHAFLKDEAEYPIPPESEDLTDTTKSTAAQNEVKEKRRQANQTAYALLNLTIKDVVGHAAVRSAVTAELPYGSARLAWQNLTRIFQPKTATQKYELEQSFNDCKYEKETRNPDEWFTELETIRVLLREDHAVIISDEKMIQHMVYNVKPKSYSQTIMILKRDLEYKSVSLDLNRVKDELRQAWGQISKIKTTETALTAGVKRKSHEAALTAGFKFKKKFKGDCRVCGAKGHKATDCWDADKNRSKRPTWYKNPEQRKRSETANLVTPNGRPRLYCTYCKKDNHTEDRCFQKRKDEKLLPPFTHSANVMLLSYDTCLLAANNKDKVNINTFIADSGASTHMVHSKHLLTNFQPSIGEIKIGDNSNMESSGTFTGYQ